jgi:DNA-binding PadR family transcriptional regulator
VSQTRDQRRRSDLDLFVLTLIASGVSTPYSLKAAADLSPGATIPALRRLLAEGMVVQAKPGPRGRADHKITAAGRRRLKSGWRVLIDEGPSGDLDADLRVALLGIWIGRERRLAVEFLKGSAARKLQEVGTAEEPEEGDSTAPLAYWYRRIRLAFAEALIKAEADAVLGMAKMLPRRTARPASAKLSTSRLQR